MPEKANVSSVDALDAFRAELILYLSRARPTLDEVASEAMRTRVWLENDQRIYWEGQLRLRARQLEQAQQALFSSRISKMREESSAELLAVHRAKRSLEDAEQKLRITRQWNRDFESKVQPVLKQLEKFHTVLSNDLPKAIAQLSQFVKTLQAYAELPAPATADSLEQPKAIPTRHPDSP